MKMPEPMIPLITIIVESNRVSRRAKPAAGWAAGGASRIRA